MAKITGGSTANLALAAGAFPVGTYTITLTVTKQNADPAVASLTLKVVPGAIPVVTIKRIPDADAAKPFDDRAMLRLEGHVAMSGTNKFKYEWSRKCVITGIEYDVCNPYFDLASSIMPGSTNASTLNLDIKPTSMGPNGKQYKFSLKATKLDSSGQLTSIVGEASKLVVTNYHPACDGTKATPACISISPAQGEALVTPFTFTAGLYNINTKAGWRDPDGADSSLQYRFGFLHDANPLPTMFGDSFGAASVNTYTTMELPAGSIRPVVVVKDMIQGTSDMFTGGNITVCAGKCNVAQTATGKATGMSTKLDSQIASYNTPADKNKMATSINTVADTINTIAVTPTTPSATLTAMRGKMATSLLAAATATTGPALDVTMAASALKSISQVPSQINADTGQRLLQVVDAIIGSPAVLANGIDRVTAGNLIATVGGVSASRATPAGGRRTAGTSGSAAGTGLLRRSAVHAEGAHRAVQMANISLAAAKQMVVDESALYFEGTRTRHGCAP